MCPIQNPDLCSFPYNEGNTFQQRKSHVSAKEILLYKEIGIHFQLLRQEAKAQMLKSVYVTVCQTFGTHSSWSVCRNGTTGLCRIIASASPMHLNVRFKTHIPEENAISSTLTSLIFIGGTWHLLNDSFFKNLFQNAVWSVFFTMINYQALWLMWTGTHTNTHARKRFLKRSKSTLNGNNTEHWF